MNTGDLEVIPCVLSERLKISEFIIKNHLDASVRNEAELKLQIDDLQTDFPDLFSDEIFQLGHYWKVEQDQNLIGAIGLTPYQDSTSIIYLSFLGVSPLHRNLGLGKKLLDIIIPFSRSKNYQFIRLTTLPGVFNSACHLYEKYGFKEISRQQSLTYNVVVLELALHISRQNPFEKSQHKIWI
jgi:ribosomal protein S18 acetylase RimI-like enzyme